MGRPHQRGSRQEEGRIVKDVLAWAALTVAVAIGTFVGVYGALQLVLS